MSSTFTSDGKFDMGKFNDVFDKEKHNRNQLTKTNENNRLAKLNSLQTYKLLRDSTISDILFGIKDTWFYLLDDLLQQKFTIDTFIKENRLFFIGVTIIFITLLAYLYEYFFEDDYNNDYEIYKKIKKQIEQKKISLH